MAAAKQHACPASCYFLSCDDMPAVDKPGHEVLTICQCERFMHGQLFMALISKYTENWQTTGVRPSAADKPYLSQDVLPPPVKGRGSAL